MSNSFAAGREVGYTLPELGPADPVEIAAVPGAPEIERNWMTTVLPALSVVGMLGFALLASNPLIIAISGGLAALSVGAGLAAARYQRRRSQRGWASRCERYRDHLAECARLLAEAGRRQVAHAYALHPPPQGALGAAVRPPRLPDNAGYLRARVGTGRATARRAPRLAAQIGDLDADAELTAAAADVVGRHSAVDRAPITVDVGPGAAIVGVGALTPVIRSMITDLALSHRPSDLRLHAFGLPTELRWVESLPHAAAVPPDAAALLRGLRRALDASHERRTHHLAILLGDDAVDAAWPLLVPVLRTENARLSLLALQSERAQPAPEATLVIKPNDAGLPGLQLIRSGREPQIQLVAEPDGLSHREAAQLADELTRSARPSMPETGSATSCLLSDLAGHGAGLRVPIGMSDEGPVLLDLREAAGGGDGPHGLIIGSTGTGKSELLRTLLVGATFQASPEELALVLIDYKGGAAFAELAALPHTAGVLTNLDDDPVAVDRFGASLRAELRRRQRLLREVAAPDRDSYEAVRAGRDELPALPRLLIVIDEYAELVEESPDVLDVLTSIGRVGRSLGLHLLLSSQRLDDGRLRGLDAHLRFRICLRTLSAADSIGVLGSRVAADLPAAPGWAWLNRDGALTRFRAALVDGLVENVVAPSAGGPNASSRTAPSPHSTRPVLLPPLPEALALVELDDPTAFGLIDRPDRGQQLPLRFDPVAEPGHLVVVGSPGSGRSSALVSVVAGLARTASPGQVAMHVVSSANGPLAGVGGLPQVGTVATSPELATQVIRTIADLVTERRAAAEPSGHVGLIVDDLPAVLRSDESLLQELVSIATTGAGVGVFLALSCGRWADLRGGLREAFANRWELRLTDPSESEHPQTARRGGTRNPGRALTEDGHWAQIALVRANADLVASIARRGGPPTRPIQLLPARVSPAALPAAGPGRAVLGITGPYADPTEAALGAGDHLIVLGNSGSGRSGLLRVLAAEAGHDRCVWQIDPRHTLRPSDGERYAVTPVQITALLTQLVDTLSAGAPEYGREHLLLIDDLDLATARGCGGAFAGLTEWVPFAADAGLSIVAARRMSGSSRASFDPFYGRLVENCATALLLSGDPGEGPVLGGVRPLPRPPGRGQLIRYGEPAEVIQAAWLEPLTTTVSDAADPRTSYA